MRLQQYINETTLSDRARGQLKEYIANNCKPFLKEFGIRYMHDYFIFRGLKTQNIKTFTKIKTRKDRLPRIIDKDLHKYLNELGKELFGWKIRSEGVFTGAHFTAQAYGDVSIFIPSGNYKYVYIKNTHKIYTLLDMHLYDISCLNDIENFINKSPDKKEARKHNQKNIDDVLSKLETIKNDIKSIYESAYKTQGLSKVLTESAYEAIFKCDEYLVVSKDNRGVLSEIMKELI